MPAHTDATSHKGGDGSDTLIAKPFQRIAMDFVGTLPRTQHGNRFILTICDYAT